MAQEQLRAQVMLAEDNPADVLLVRHALQEHGITARIEVAADGEEAFLLIDRFDSGSSDFRPDIVLLDLNLPKRTGHEVLEKLRHTECCAAVPVIVLSSSEAPQDRAATESLGTIYFGKPCELDDFLALGKVVRTILGGSPRQDIN